MTDNTNELNQAARNIIYNFLDRELFPRIKELDHSCWRILHEYIGARSLNLTHKRVTNDGGFRLSYAYQQSLDSLLLKGNKKDVIKFLEFLLEDLHNVQNILTDKLGTKEYYRVCDYYRKFLSYAFNKYNVGYKTLGLTIVPITDEEEMQEMERVPFDNAKQHLENALRHLSVTDNPDFFTSMDESMKAVESAAKELTNKDDATLADCLRVFESKNIILHPAFKEALGKLYGFAGDNPGLRHARTKSKESLQENRPTARFMFVVCSAFVNYIIANAD